MTPLHMPPFDYLTVGPWLVSFEWHPHPSLDETFAAVVIVDLPHAIFKFWDSMETYGRFGDPSAPARRVVVDARGIMILGAISERGHEVAVVATKEIIDLQEDLGAPTLDLMELELEIRWIHETSQ